jgi:hypothetical protein
MSTPKILDVSVEKHSGKPDTWTVEAIDSDGGIAKADFSGPTAETIAKAFAFMVYGWKEEETE